MKKSILPSFGARNALVKLGADIAAARKRRGITQARLAEGAGVNVSTVRRLEAGDHGVSLGVLAMALIVLGEQSRLGDLIDIGGDDVGLLLANQKLPQRVRPPRTKVVADGGTPASPRFPENDDDGMAF